MGTQETNKQEINRKYDALKEHDKLPVTDSQKEYLWNAWKEILKKIPRKQWDRREYEKLIQWNLKNSSLSEWKKSTKRYH